MVKSVAVYIILRTTTVLVIVIMKQGTTPFRLTAVHHTCTPVDLFVVFAIVQFFSSILLTNTSYRLHQTESAAHFVNFVVCQS